MSGQIIKGKCMVNHKRSLVLLNKSKVIKFIKIKEGDLLQQVRKFSADIMHFQTHHISEFLNYK